MYRELFSKLSIEDKVVLMRFTLAVVIGVASYLLYLLNPSIELSLDSVKFSMDSSTISWLMSAVAYVLSIPIALRIGAKGLFQTIIRGLLTYYTTWLIIFIVIYDLLKML
ncbi:MAG: hypothetical protein RMI83_06310 [Desulfurococcaceae archaeon]|nr:hypothetical protein [Sulfolobales archaeon]MDW8170691.1 hypothetical protein [Desulfurococcaceae archaeon]